MGKNLKYGNLVTRPKTLAFWKLPTGTYQRMEGFTDLSYSQNPKEYSRQYVDEEFERTDIVGYAPSTSYSFDRYTGNEVLADIVKITDNEYIGDLMKRTIVTVDLSSGSNPAPAKMRDFSVIPDTNGDTTDCMTYSGNFKAKGELIDCTATSSDDWQTIRVTQKINYSTTAYISVTGDGVQNEISSGGATHVTGNVTAGTTVTITVNADYNGAVITLYRISGGYPSKISSSIGRLDAEQKISSDTSYYAVVSIDDEEKGYMIDLTAVDSSSVQTASAFYTASEEEE